MSDLVKRLNGLSREELEMLKMEARNETDGSHEKTIRDILEEVFERIIF